MPRSTSSGLLITVSALSLVLVAGTSSDRAVYAQGRPLFLLRPETGTPTSASERKRTEAEEAYQRGDYAKTIELADAVLLNDAEDYIALYLRASARVELGRIRGDSGLLRNGVADARESIRLSRSKNANCYLPYLYGMVSLATVEGHQPHAEVAVRVASQLIGNPSLKDEDVANILYQRAGASVFLADYDAAVVDYEEAIKRHPSHLGAYLALADTHNAAGNKEKAASALDRAVATFPNNPLVFNNRGMFRQAAGNGEKAVADFARAIELDPNYFVAYMNRGFTLMEMSKLAEAEQDFSTSLRINPHQPTAHSLRGTARLAQGRLPQAIEDYRAVVQHDPQNPVAHADLGFAQFFSQDYSNSIASLDQAAKLDPNLRYLDPWRYWSQICAGHAAKAKTGFQSVLQKPAEQRDWTDFLLLFLMEKVDETALLHAIRAEDASLRSAQMCEAHFFIGQQQEHKGQPEQAIAHYRQALEGNAKHLSAYRGAQFALQRLSQQAASKQ